MSRRYKTNPDSFQMALKNGTLPSYMKVWSPERLQIVEELYNLTVFLKDIQPGKITVIDAPCGLGKSSLMRGIAVLAAEGKLDAVMMTDSNQRLRDDIESAIKQQGGTEWLKVKNDVAWLSDWDTVEAAEWKTLILSHLVALSTQRFLMVNSDVRKNACTIYRMGQPHWKDALFCDEAIQDVDSQSWFYSDIKRQVGIFRETIRPESEWEENIGRTAKRAERYAERLVEDLQLEIDRINAIKLPDNSNGTKAEGQMHIDLYLGRQERNEEYGKIWRGKWDEILAIVTDIRDDIKAVKKDMRSPSENRLFSDLAKVIKNMQNLSEKTRPETIVSTLEDIVNLTKFLPIGGIRAGLKDIASTALDAAERYYALPELEKILKNNRDNMYQNSEHVRDAMTAEQFLDIFRYENVVFVQGSNYGDDKNDKNGQILIHVFRYNMKYFPYENMPCFIFDGTARINPMYDNKELFDVRHYEKPKTHVGFVHLDEKMSKTYLNGKGAADHLYKRMRDFLTDTYGVERLNPAKIMVSGIKQHSDWSERYGLARSEGHIDDGTEDYPIVYNPQTGEKGPISMFPYASFGSKYCTGENIYKDCCLLCKISTMRLKQETVLGQMCCRDKVFLNRLLEMNESYRARQLELIFAYGADRSDLRKEIDDAAIRTALAAVIQEINRLRIRNWCERPEDAKNYDITVIWAIRSRKQGTFDKADEDFYEKLLRLTMEYFGSDPAKKEDYRYIPSKMHPRYESHEKIGTKMHKLYEWWKGLKAGTEFTKNDMAEAVGMTKGALNAMLAKPQNQEIVKLIRGENDCNVRKAKGRAGYIYVKPVTEEDEKPAEETVIYEQQTLKFSNVM